MNDEKGQIRSEWAIAILDSITDGVFTVDRRWRITSFNRAAERITGIPREEVLEKPCCEVFRASICETDCPLRRTIKTGSPVYNKTAYIVTAQGEQIPISISTALLQDESGQIIGGVEIFRDLSVVEELRKELSGRYTFFDIISKSPKIQRIFQILPRFAASESSVLIEGESGTGKELLARAIHNLSPRREKPFVAVNCGALPDTLLESEFFGYKAGAFTDAKRDKPGRFALAEGGTMFLDEIGEISPALQVRLLRVLQDRTYEPLGATRPVPADVRIIVATNRHLSDLVEEGIFRRDLYYRINVVRLVLPPLRERREDIPLLVEHFVSRFNRLQGRHLAGASPEVLEILMSYDFHGNVRELQNIIEYAFVVCGGEVIQPQHLPEGLRPAIVSARQFSGPETLEGAEKRLIINALERNGWNRLAAARELDIHKSTLFRKLKRFDIRLPSRDGRSRKN